MLKLTFKLIFTAVVLVTLFSLSPSKIVSAAIPECTNPATTAEAIKCGSNDAAGAPANANPSNIDDTISQVINILTAVVGIVAVIMIIIGGFRYTTSGGSAEKISGAKSTLLYAIIGLIIVALAQVIARFVLHKATTSGS